MFTHLTVRNVQEAYVRGLRAIREEGQLEETRNGGAYVIPWPVLTIYERPMERVLLDPVRDANPFFHLQEGLWMLAGRNDVESIGRFIGGLKKYSDDGVTYHGAYGHRWRRHFGEDHSCVYQEESELDQLKKIIELLRANPGDRRIVLQMWDPETDLAREGKDFPCNTEVLFRVVKGTLLMTLFNRSNDAIWGAYGANAVHFSVLHEFMAAACGLKVGAMYQWSNNLHAYTETLEKIGEPQLYRTRDMGYVDADSPPGVNLTMYSAKDFVAEPLFNHHHGVILDPDFILDEIEAYWNETMSSPPRFFSIRGLRTLELCRDSYLAYKAKEYEVALSIANGIPHVDWRRACVEWLERRAANRAAKAGD